MPAVIPHWMRLPPYTVHARYTAQQISERIPWQIADYRVPDAWPQTTGKGVRVGIIDTGCDEVHVEQGDLAGAVAEWKDFSGSRRGPVDRDGHGTHVAGIIGCRKNNKGLIGVAPDCSLLVAKALGDDGSGSMDAVAAALDWLCESGCRVVNMSLGGPDPDPRLQSVIRAAADAGVIVVCAAGNEGGEVDFPGRWPECLAVSAVDKMRRIAPWSCRGKDVDLGAPGVEILSTYKGGGYAVLSGTSMAAPFVAGLVALWLATRGEQKTTLSDVFVWLQQTAEDAGQPGKDSLYGFGLPGPKMFREKDAPPAPAIGKTIRVRFPGGGEVLLSGGELVG